LAPPHYLFACGEIKLSGARKQSGQTLFGHSGGKWQGALKSGRKFGRAPAVLGECTTARSEDSPIDRAESVRGQCDMCLVIASNSSPFFALVKADRLETGPSQALNHARVTNKFVLDDCHTG
jgi:hypothetical protein